MQLTLLREQFGERLEAQETDNYVDCSSGNSVINNQSDEMSPGEANTSVHKQRINTGHDDDDIQGGVCCTPLPPPPPSPPPPPPPPPPALQLPTNQIRSILSKPIWMKKEM